MFNLFRRKNIKMKNVKTARKFESKFANQKWQLKNK